MKKPSRQSSAPTEASRISLFDEDLFEQLRSYKGSSLWLGRFSEETILRALEKSGFLAALDSLGLHRLLVQIEPLDTFLQSLKVYHTQPRPEHLMAEFRLRETTLAPRKRCADAWGEVMPRVLAIEWLLLQNPYATFTNERPMLPGQTHPGLGQAKRILELLIHLAKHLELEGISNYPEYFHNAFLYQHFFYFYDPEREGMLEALSRDLAELSLAEQTWAIERGRVRYATGEAFVWESDLLILPLSQRVRDYFEGASYRAAVAAAKESQRFCFVDAPR